MAKKQQFYFYNEQTLQFEEIAPSLGTKLKKIGLYVFSVFAAAGIAFWGLDQIIATPGEIALQKEVAQMKSMYEGMQEQVALMEKVVNNLRDRDAGVYRTLFGMEPIDDNMWEGGIGGHDPSSNIIPYKHSDKLLSKAQEKVNKLKRQIYLQSITMDTLESLTKNRETMLASIPSIKPVREDKLRRKVQYLSGFGMRPHPIHKVVKMHKGIDFTAPKGTEIQSTGDGVVVKVLNKKYGYGKHVVIDHGFGYETLYGHMSKVLVKKGQHVKRGQIIGKVGSTGTSTASHCHYEVHYKGRAVNPIYYVMDGLSPEAYQELVDKASVVNQSFD